MNVYTGDISDRQGMYHWGIKGQKWGVRRFQNEDGSLTDEGKKRYMYAARHNQLNYKKLSDKDLDMINNRFKKEDTYKKNVKAAQEAMLSKKIAKAAGKTSMAVISGAAKRIGKVFGSPISGAIKGAFKFKDVDEFKPEKEEKEDSRREQYERGSGFIVGSMGRTRVHDLVNNNQRVSTGERFSSSSFDRPASEYGWGSSWNTSNNRSSESVLFNRNATHVWRAEREAEHQQRAVANAQRYTSNKRKKNKKKMQHSDETEYIIFRSVEDYVLHSSTYYKIKRIG